MDATTLCALAEPNRLRIVEMLREHPMSVNEIALLLKIRQPQASKHLHTLSGAGLVSVQPHAQQRIYSLNAEPFIRFEEWLRTFDQYWHMRFNNLEQYLSEAKEG
jgi:DNA-binding transcriptional ArsR family regulator